MIEGDSNLVIDALKKLNYNSSSEKISHGWRIALFVQNIGEILPWFDYIIPSHVRREGNKAVYFLVNWGCLNIKRTLDSPWPS